ncbi:MAG: hypothetical protein ACFFCV_20845 [Promethearchaeota archaeon]
MSKIYVCRECGYAFPQELSHLIESNIQVYCERCGSPFVLEGVEFTPAQTPYRRGEKPYQLITEKASSNLDKLIQGLNKISSIPLVIFIFISFLVLITDIPVYWELLGLSPGQFILNWISRILQAVVGIILLTYDKGYISKKVKEKKYNEIFLDSFCWGILGCILHGLGAIILLKGIAIAIHVITDSKNKELKAYNYGLLAKNSLNHLSTKAGFFIILLTLTHIVSEGGFIFLNAERMIIIDFIDIIEIPQIYLIFGILLTIAIIVLLIDKNIKGQIIDKDSFQLIDSIKFLVLGIFATTFYAAGIFILLKGILLFILFTGKPKKVFQPVPTVEKPYVPTPPMPPTPPIPPPPSTPILRKTEIPEKPIIEEKVVETKPVEKPTEPKTPLISKKEDIEEKKEEIEETTRKELELIPIVIDKEERIKREEEYELKLHESLLPVKDEKDKKLVKEYFSKIFTLLSKDLRNQITELKVSKKEKRELLEELAFLTQEEQVKYIDSIVSLYKEIPKKLINRIRKLPNVKPKHYDKIVEQLKFMDVDEQIKFVQFLEENA